MSEDHSDVLHVNKKGKKLTVSSLREFDFEPNSGKWEITPESRKLHEEARKLGINGQQNKAIEKFLEAHEQAPDWPYPLYDAAFAYLLVKDFPKALELYRKVDRMAPDGFFTAPTAVDILSREEEGDLPHGIYLLYMQIEWTPDPAEKKRIAELLTEKAPQFAPAWMEIALLTDDQEQKMAFLKRALNCDPDRETRGVLEINKAILHHQKGETEEAVSILGEMVLDKQETLGVRAMARETLLHIVADQS